MISKNSVHEITIYDTNNLGFGVGKTDGIVTFVSGAHDGDRVRARIIKATKSYLVAKVEEIIEPSPYRADYSCPVGASCGGCAYAGLSYERELYIKRRSVEQEFKKVGLSVKVNDVLTDGKTEHYRNKGQYPTRGDAGNIQIGFFAAKSHRIVPCTDCLLECEDFRPILEFIKELCAAHGIEPYNEVTGGGILRHIYLRRGEISGDISLCFVLTRDALPSQSIIAAKIKEKFPAVKSISLNINPDDTNVILGKKFKLIDGDDFITDRLCGVKLKITPAAFYQVNHGATEILYKKAKELADIKNTDTLLDIYCGIGSIGLSMAQDAKKVIGVEVVESAVACAKENAEANNISNAEFFCADAADCERLLENAESKIGKINPNVIILDPPRKGCDERLLKYAARLSPEKIVYVSCNPATLARDAKILTECGYEIREAYPVNMFPRTGHVETVVLMSRAEK